jgi:peptidoglycan hydrolase-like protein with peptidoglycan-binding domain
MKKFQKLLAKVIVLLCLSFFVVPDIPLLTNSPVVVTAQAASYNKATIKHIQQKINAAGYHCGTPDGVIGKNTKTAIKKYQKKNGLNVTGTVNRTLLESLNVKIVKSSHQEKKDTIVYVTESGTKYHRAGCRYL